MNTFKRIILSAVILVAISSVIVRAADWSNPNPQTVADKAGQLLLKHELNMTDLYTGAASKLNQLRSNFSGSGSPASPTTGQNWYDTTHLMFKLYDGTGSGWGAGGFYSSGTSSLATLQTGTFSIANAFTMVATATSITNLNADKLDGAHASTTPTAGQIPIVNGSSKAAISITGNCDGSATSLTGISFVKLTHSFGTISGGFGDEWYTGYINAAGSSIAVSSSSAPENLLAQLKINYNYGTGKIHVSNSGGTDLTGVSVNIVLMF